MNPAPKIWTVGTLKYTLGGLIVLFCLLLWGDFAMSMKERAVTPVFQVVLHKFGASDSLFALLCGSLPAAIALILIPIIAYKSDRHRGRWGRRIPYVFIPVPFAALSMAGLGFSPLLGNRLHSMLGSSAPDLNTCVLLMFGFFWVVYDFANIASSAVFLGLINDVVPREIIGRFFGAFRAVSLLAGIIFNHYMMNQAATAYLEIFVGMALLFGFGFGLICLFLKEGEYPPPPPPGPHEGFQGFVHAARNFFVEGFSIPYYLWYFAATICAVMAFVPANLYNIPFAASLDINYGDCIALTFTISLALAYPLGAMADRFHPLLLGLIVLFLYMLVTLWGGFFARDSTTFSIALILHGVLAGTYGTLTASLGNRLLPRANFAQLTAAGGILGSICSIVIPPLIGGYLDHSGHVYRHTYLLSSSFAALGCLLLVVLYFQFQKYGGTKNYVAPDRNI